MNKVINFFEDWTMFEKIWLFLSSITMIILSFIWGDNIIALISGLTGMISVVLCAKGKISNYLFGAINAITYAYLCFSQKLYGELMYNTVYMLPMILFGVFSWKKNMSSENSEVKTRNLSLKGWLILIFGTLITILVYRQILKLIGGNMAWLDATTTIFSGIATFLMVTRFSEQWIMWIIVNGLSISMWGIILLKGDMSAISTVVMWTAYLFNSIYGYINWRKLSKTQ